LASGLTALLETVVSKLDVGVLVYRLDTPDDALSLRLCYVNDAASEAMHIDGKKLVGMKILEAFPKLKGTGIPQRFYECIAGGQAIDLGDVAYGDAQIPTSVFSTRGMAVDDEHIVICVSNVTELRRTESAAKEAAAKLRNVLHERNAQLLKGEKLATLGSLLAGIAHEVRTPLAALSSNNGNICKMVQLALKHIPEDNKKARRALDRVVSTTETNVTAINRLTELVAGIRRVTRADTPEPTDLDVHEVIEATLTVLRHELKYGITLTKNFGTLPMLEGHPGQLGQVFTNLIVNGVQAMDGKGCLTITTELVDDEVRISIEDQGCGIPEEAREQLFDSGFSTKPASIGTGLGLAITSEIVRTHKGRIEVESEVGKGSKFTVVLPLRAEDPPQLSTPPKEDDSLLGFSSASGSSEGDSSAGDSSAGDSSAGDSSAPSDAGSGDVDGG
jgi:signal transduction histidine kinase